MDLEAVERNQAAETGSLQILVLRPLCSSRCLAGGSQVYSNLLSSASRLIHPWSPLPAYVQVKS